MLFWPAYVSSGHMLRKDYLTVFLLQTLLVCFFKHSLLLPSVSNISQIQQATRQAACCKTSRSTVQRLLVDVTFSFVLS